LWAGIALLSALCLPVFGGESQRQGSGAGNIAWEHFKEINPKARIEKAQASFGIWKDGGLAFLIVTDFVGSSRERSSGKGVGLDMACRRFRASEAGQRILPQLIKQSWRWPGHRRG
jgi:hypothetical protein